MLCKVQEPATCCNNSVAHGHPGLRCSKGLPALHAMVQANWTVFVHDVTGRLQGLLKLALHADRWGCTGGSPREDIASCPCDKRTLRVCVPSPDSRRLPVLDKPETSCPAPCASESMLSLVRTPLEFEGTFSFESRFSTPGGIRRFRRSLAPKQRQRAISGQCGCTLACSPSCKSLKDLHYNA